MALKHRLPWRKEGDLEAWDPVSEARDLAETVEQALAGTWYPARMKLLSRLFGESEGERLRPWIPAVDVEETPKEFVVSVSLPGLKREDIEVEVSEDALTVRGERKSEKKEGDGFKRVEQPYGRFYRRMRLPVPVKSGEAKAAYKDGLLRITLPKTKESAGRSVPVE